MDTMDIIRIRAELVHSKIVSLKTRILKLDPEVFLSKQNILNKHIMDVRAELECILSQLDMFATDMEN